MPREKGYDERNDEKKYLLYWVYERSESRGAPGRACATKDLQICGSGVNPPTVEIQRGNRSRADPDPIDP